jgi:hypothetical protein
VADNGIGNDVVTAGASVDCCEVEHLVCPIEPIACSSSSSSDEVTSAAQRAAIRQLPQTRTDQQLREKTTRPS